MQLYGTEFDCLDDSKDISAALEQILNMVKAIDCKLDQVKEDSQALRDELARVTNTVEVLKTEVRDLKATLAENGGKEVASQEVNIQPAVSELVGKYNETTDWYDLSEGLQKILDSDSVEYHQLLSINDYSWGHLWQVGSNGYQKLATLLMDAGLHPNKTDNKGDTMLHGAAEGGQVLMAKLLLDRGADINLRGWRGLTPFNKAALGGKPEMVRWLAERCADIYSADDHGMTSLHFAAEHGHLEVVWLLVHLGLKTNTRDVNGNTPLKWAKRNRCSAVIGYLSSHTPKL